jgi:hypothetical protein
MQNILRDSMLALYRDSPEIFDALIDIDWSKVESKFRNEVFARIDPDTFYKVDGWLHSDDYLRYKSAIDSSAQSCTTELAQIIEFTLQEREGGLH